MNKKILIPLIALVLVLCGGIVWLFFSLQEQKQVNEEMQELVEMDKQEMEDEYAHFALQYDEMKTQITNDSIVAQLAQEQEKTEQLLEELKRVKATDAREIARLKKELETVRAVLRDYVMQIDSLNRLNENLMAENSRVNAELEQRTAQVAGLSSEKASLSEKVAIASQLDAAGIQLKLLNKRGKDTKKLKDCKQMQVDFSITRNVNAANGHRTIYVRIQCAGWRWYLRLREPSAGVLCPQGDRIYRGRDPCDGLLECLSDVGGRRLSREYLCRWKYDRNKNI